MKIFLIVCSYFIFSFLKLLAVEKIYVSVDNPRIEKTSIHLYLKNDSKIIWEKEVEVPDNFELDFSQVSLVNEDKGVLLYFKSDYYASQWKRLEKINGTFKFKKGDNKVKLFRKKYAIIEYEFYQGENRNFKDREPTAKGVVAVSHWGQLPHFGSDWQIWQGSMKKNIFGNVLLLQNHRLDTNLGFSKPMSKKLEDLNKAPEKGYSSGGNCGVKIPAKINKSYYCRNSGYNEEDKGYGKIYIRDILFEVPEGMKILGR